MNIWALLEVWNHQWWIYFSLLGGHRKYPISAFNPQRNISQLAAPRKGRIIYTTSQIHGFYPYFKGFTSKHLLEKLPLNWLVASPVIEGNTMFASKKQLPNLAKVTVVWSISSSKTTSFPDPITMFLIPLISPLLQNHGSVTIHGFASRSERVLATRGTPDTKTAGVFIQIDV